MYLPWLPWRARRLSTRLHAKACSNAPLNSSTLPAGYGGWATLCGLAHTPELFCCGVDYVGVSDPKTEIDTIPPYWHAPS